jgi:thiol-disulfide isomerase/thioredoxin
MKIALFILFVKILLIFPKKILELNNESFNKLLELHKYDKNKKLFLVFYTKNCKNCKEAINIINDIIDKYKYDKEIDFGKVDCDLRENIWLNLRFNITRIPYIILIINGNIFYELNSNYDKFEISHFINDIKNDKDSLKIPNDIDIYKKRIIILNYTINYISQFFKYHFNINISKNLIIFILISLLLTFIYIIIDALKYCCINIILCGKCRKKNENPEKKKIEDLSGISSNVSGSENESKSKEEEEIDNSIDISGISKSLFIDDDDDESKDKVIHKEKIE